MGIFSLAKSHTEETARQTNHVKPEILSPSEACLLGAALSLDNAAAGLGAGLSGCPVPTLLLLSFLLGILLILAGVRLGRLAAGILRFDFSKLGGLLLILLGLMKLMTGR